MFFIFHEGRRKSVSLRERQLETALKAVSDHPILNRDEYFKSFLVVNRFDEYLPMVKNVESPLELKKEYFRWRIGGGTNSNYTKEIGHVKVK